MSGCRFRGRKKTWQTDSYHPTLALKCGSNDCVLTKISHNFHCHFNAPTLCGGLQRQRWRQRVGGGRGTGRHWSKDKKRKRKRRGGESLELGYNLSVTPYSSNHAAIQTNPDRRSHHTHKHTYCICVILDPLSPHFERLKMCLSKGPVPDSLLQPLQEDVEDRRCLSQWEERSRNNKADQKPPELTDVHDQSGSMTSTMFSERKGEAFKGLDRGVFAFNFRVMTLVEGCLCAWLFV